MFTCEGTRMWRRGADSDGYVANYVESEQIIKFHGYRASFVQVTQLYISSGLHLRGICIIRLKQ